MGINREDQLTNSLEEVDVGPGIRSYECVFCRRGFTTAQALGGHMNIHRKDRAKSRPSYLSNNNMNSNKHDQDQDHSFYANSRFYHPVFTSYPQTYVSETHDNHQEGNVGYAEYFSCMSSSSQLINYENNQSPSREDKMMNLSLQFGWSHGENEYHRESKRRTREPSNEDELDLELRLGHDPRSSSNVFM
ncbi:uncharacterized protein LOC143590121 [Bidens hawaiensis]|uniref:uncharacterized protein LOC143590121 n=1 Tax=Bidens hawaiensis TaxID=980011 RepID=UPI0040495038